MLISFVIPCYRSVKTLPKVVATIQETLKEHPGFGSEIILVNDASPDDTWGTIRSLCSEYDNVKGIDLAKNSGQQAAILAGLRYSKGDLVAVSDDDGQTWHTDTILNGMVKPENTRHFITGPGRGIQLTKGAHAGRLLVPV